MLDHAGKGLGMLASYLIYSVIKERTIPHALVAMGGTSDFALDVPGSGMLSGCFAGLVPATSELRAT